MLADNPPNSFRLCWCPSPFLLRRLYLCVFPFTLHLPVDFVHASSFRPTYLYSFGRPFTSALVNKLVLWCAWLLSSALEVLRLRLRLRSLVFSVSFLAWDWF